MKVMKKLHCYNLGGYLIDIGCGPGHLAIVIGEKYPVLTVTGVENGWTILRSQGTEKGKRGFELSAGKLSPPGARAAD